MRTELESILVEQALAMARELELVSDAAPDGQVLAVSELAAPSRRAGADPRRPPGHPQPPGRTRREKGALGRACPYGGTRQVKDQTSRHAVTAAGRVTLCRRSMRYPRCGVTGDPAGDCVGIDGFLNPQATRLACVAAATWSFDVAAERLD